MFYKTTGMTFSVYDVYYYDPDSNLFAWKNGSDYMLSEIIGVPLTVDGGSAVYPDGFTYNSERVYKSPCTGYYYLWYDSTGGQWIISNILGYAIREVDAGEGESPRWTGDAWFSLAGTSPIGTYVPRGSLKEGTPPADKVIAAGQIEGWIGEELVGNYEIITGSSVTGSAYLGCLRFEDEVANLFTEDSDTYNSKPTFSSTGYSIWWDSGNSVWVVSEVIGVLGAIYWTSETLSLTEENQFIFKDVIHPPQTDTTTTNSSFPPIVTDGEHIWATTYHTRSTPEGGDYLSFNMMWEGEQYEMISLINGPFTVTPGMELTFASPEDNDIFITYKDCVLNTSYIAQLIAQTTIWIPRTA